MRQWLSWVLCAVVVGGCNCGNNNGPDSGTVDSGNSGQDSGAAVDAGFDAGVIPFSD